MRRREFVALVGGAVLAGPPAAKAQEPGRTYRLGVVTISPPTTPYFAAMFDELRRLGFVEGQNLTVDWRSFGPRVDLIPKFVAEVVNGKVDVIYVTGEPGIRAAQQATTTIPIIGFTEDMVGSGLVNSLARPGGNITGVSVLAMELNVKRQEILIEAVPGLRRVAALTDPQHDVAAAAPGTARRGAGTRRRTFDSSGCQSRGNSSGHRRNKGIGRSSAQRVAV